MKKVIFLICSFLIYSCASESLKKSNPEILEELRNKVECTNCNPTQEDLFLYFHYLNKNVPTMHSPKKSFGVLQSDQNGWDSPQLYTSSSNFSGRSKRLPFMSKNKIGEQNPYFPNR